LQISSRVTDFFLIFSSGSTFYVHIYEGNELGHFRLSATKQHNETLRTEAPVNGTTRVFKNRSFIDCTTILGKGFASLLRICGFVEHWKQVLVCICAAIPGTFGC